MFPASALRDSDRRRANARNVSLLTLLWPIYVINSVDNTKLPCFTNNTWLDVRYEIYYYIISWIQDVFFVDRGSVDRKWHWLFATVTSPPVNLFSTPFRTSEVFLNRKWRHISRSFFLSLPVSSILFSPKSTTLDPRLLLAPKPLLLWKLITSVRKDKSYPLSNSLIALKCSSW